MITLGRLVRLMTPFRWWIVLTILVAFGTLGASVGLMAMSAYLISKAALVTAFADVAVAVTAVRALAIARAALRYVERYLSHLVTFRMLTRLRVWLYTAVEPLAPARLQTYRDGDLLARIGSDIDTLDQFYVRVVAPPVAAALVTALACVILGTFDAWLGLVLLLFLFVTGGVLPLVTWRVSRVPAHQLVAQRAHLTSLLTDDIQGLADLMGLSREALLVDQVSRMNGEIERTQLRLSAVRGMSQALAGLLAGLAGVTVLGLGIPLVTGGQIDGIFLALLPLTAIASFEAVQPLGAAVQQLEASQAAAKRIFDLSDTAPPVADGPATFPRALESTIEFRRVTFQYGATEPIALYDVSFVVPPGGSLGIIGPTGAGKSTLVNLLLRFWEIQAGQILIGGHDVRDVRGDDVRAVLGVASQHTHLFNGTIRDNLLLAKGDASESEIVAACHQALLHDFIAAQPFGYDTRTGDNGLKLSGGERQRLAIARVILRNAPILVLDEATSNLDTETERRLMAALHPFMAGRTTLIISHRETIHDYVDRCLALDHGRLVDASQPYGPATTG